MTTVVIAAIVRLLILIEFCAVIDVLIQSVVDLMFLPWKELLNQFIFTSKLADKEF
jgi:hypothetical protein